MTCEQTPLVCAPYARVRYKEWGPIEQAGGGHAHLLVAQAVHRVQRQWAARRRAAAFRFRVKPTCGAGGASRSASVGRAMARRSCCARWRQPCGGAACHARRTLRASRSPHPWTRCRAAAAALTLTLPFKGSSASRDSARAMPAGSALVLTLGKPQVAAPTRNKQPSAGASTRGRREAACAWRCCRKRPARLR